MAVSDHMKPGYGPRRACQIVTVDPAKRKIEAALKDQTIVQIAVFDTPEFFVWPTPRERWTIQQCNGIWMLDRRLGENDEMQINDLQPGEGKISADIIKTPSGKSVITIDDSTVKSGQVIGFENGAWVPMDIENQTFSSGLVRYGNGAPDTTIGDDGDFYIDMDDYHLYGPKINSVWMDGVDLNPNQSSVEALSTGLGLKFDPEGDYNGSASKTIQIDTDQNWINLELINGWQDISTMGPGDNGFESLKASSGIDTEYLLNLQPASYQYNVFNKTIYFRGAIYNSNVIDKDICVIDNYIPSVHTLGLAGSLVLKSNGVLALPQSAYSGEFSQILNGLSIQIG